MTEDTKMILEKMDEMSAELHKEIQTLRKEMHEGFEDTYAAISNCYNTLNARIDAVEQNLTQKIDDLQQVTGRNCYELTLLKAKQA